MIKELSVQNVRGLGNESFKIDLLPNKPALLIASNGFGKSSIAKAFSSLNRERIKLNDEDFHNGDSSLIPSLELLFHTDSGDISLKADNETNTISPYFDYYVIASNMHAKGIGKRYGNFTQVSASIIADDIILFDTVPDRIDFPYTFSEAKSKCAWLSKTLINLNQLFSNELFCKYFLDNEIISLIGNTNQIRQQEAIQSFKNRISSVIESMTKQKALEVIEQGEIRNLENITHLSSLATFLLEFDDTQEIYKKAMSFVLAIQISELFRENTIELKKYCLRKSFEYEKKRLTSIFSSFNTSWQNFTPKESKGRLVIEFPNLSYISNGQRDSLNFIASIEHAKRKLKKKNSILIIDEVFDYMDEANIVAAQYYISSMIDQYIEDGKSIYPIILTHLSAELFGGYIFGNKKKIQVKYLKETNCIVCDAMKKLLRERNDKGSSLKTPIECFLLHYNPNSINLRPQFRHVGLKETWGESNNFRNFTKEEIKKYLDISNTCSYDPSAVCCEIRVKIEELVYEKIGTTSNKLRFIDEFCSGTTEKLEFCESIGIKIPETFFLLGLIYNESLHWKDEEVFERKMSSRLKNMTIRNMISDLYKKKYF